MSRPFGQTRRTRGLAAYRPGADACQRLLLPRVAVACFFHVYGYRRFVDRLKTCAARLVGCPITYANNLCPRDSPSAGFSTRCFPGLSHEDTTPVIRAGLLPGVRVLPRDYA
jgi:hypothetical protein